MVPRVNAVFHNTASPNLESSSTFYLTNSSFKNLWKLVTRRCGPVVPEKGRCSFVLTDEKVTPHVLRHTYATRCFEAGMDIKEVQHLLGHADPTVTLKIYTHYCEQSRQEATFSSARTAMQR